MASYDSIVAPMAALAASQLGDSTAEILGQWNAETGYGSEQTGGIANNPGNVEVNGTVQSFPTMAQGVAAYIQTEQHYGTNDAGSPSAFAEANAGYDPTNPNYPSLVLGTIDGAQTQAAANGANGSDAALLDSVPDGAELAAAEKGHAVYNPSTMGDVTKDGQQVTSGTGKGKPDTVGSGFSLFDLNLSKWFDEHWEYLVIILAIVLLIGAGIFGLSKSVTGSGFLPIPE